MRQCILAMSALLMGAGFYTSPAFALETGQCLPAAQAREALAVEGMNPIIIGNRTGYGYPTSLIFFSNADGSRGYLVRGDKPLGQQADTACIDSVYRDVKLNDIAKPAIPTWAKMGDDQKTAEAICKRDRLGYQEKCNSNDVSVIGLAESGQRVAFVATGTAINPRDHSIRAGQRLTVTINGSVHGGLIKASTPQGASYMLSAYTDVGLTQFGQALLSGGR